ncbi:thiazole tautomerase (transcriptional regulator TenI) [Salisediminibacterium halotolerans]|uniref:Thiazole tautomerase (Transcriptional regulator TenI) n=2 Tax=Salisediminibacterium halotolerans TaxID=517425 RepID=A0A1H9VYB8_9BACI|nr:thiazole tautomerase (transcriptional regulator TenI) [Salisediminibacterium haloalkalitolerans]
MAGPEMINGMHVISDGRQSLAEWLSICRSCEEAAAVFHLREKERPAGVIAEWIEAYRTAGLPLAKLRVNDRVDAAWLAGIKQVQLPQQGLSPGTVKAGLTGMYVSVSVHSLTEALQAEREGADEVLFGHVFSTDSKRGLASRGPEQLAEIAANLSIPVVAIGGITPENIADVRDAGAAGAAVLSGITSAPDPEEAVKSYQKRWGKNNENAD